MPARTTLREVAAAAGISVSAASLALSGSRRIAAATVARVRAAAAALGYVRDQSQAAAAATRFRHGGRPALVAAWIADRNALPALRAHAAGMGMSVVALDADPAGLAAGLQRIAPAALVVQRRDVGSSDLRHLRLPVVLWSDEGEGEPAVDLVETCEWWTASVQAVARVRAAGYRRPAAVLVAAKPPHWHDDVRLAAMRSLRLPVLVWDGALPPLRAFVARHRPDAVVGSSIHVWRALQRIGRPRPFAALLTFDSPWHRACAGWRENHDRRVRMTLELIEQRLRYGERPPCRIVVAPHWQVGTSLPPAAG